MSNDLISRKAVMEYLQEQQANVIIEKNKNNPVTYGAAKGMLASVDAFMNFIVQAPIAYDLDKVVERLEERKADREKEYKTASLQDGSYMLSMVFRESAKAYERAIEIAKGGGVDAGNNP